MGIGFRHYSLHATYMMCRHTARLTQGCLLPVVYVAVAVLSCAAAAGCRSCSSEMDAEGLRPQLDDLMAQLEERYGQRLPSGYNPNLKFMSHLWEPLRHIYRWVVLNVRLLY